MRQMVHIYALLEPETGDVRYIGQTGHEPEQRLRSHMSTAKRTPYKDDRCQWLASLRGDPGLWVLESVFWPLGDIAERRWIRRGRRAGWRLLNANSGRDRHLRVWGPDPWDEDGDFLGRSATVLFEGLFWWPDLDADWRVREFDSKWIGHSIGPLRGEQPRRRVA